MYRFKTFKTLANNIPTLRPYASCDDVCCALGLQLDTVLSNTYLGVSYAHDRLKSYFFFCRSTILIAVTYFRNDGLNSHNKILAFAENYTIPPVEVPCELAKVEITWIESTLYSLVSPAY